MRHGEILLLSSFKNVSFCQLFKDCFRSPDFIAPLGYVNPNVKDWQRKYELIDGNFRAETSRLVERVQLGHYMRGVHMFRVTSRKKRKKLVIFPIEISRMKRELSSRESAIKANFHAFPIKFAAH